MTGVFYMAAAGIGQQAPGSTRASKFNGCFTEQAPTYDRNGASAALAAMAPTNRHSGDNVKKIGKGGSTSK